MRPLQYDCFWVSQRRLHSKCNLRHNINVWIVYVLLIDTAILVEAVEGVVQTHKNTIKKMLHKNIGSALLRCNTRRIFSLELGFGLVGQR